MCLIFIALKRHPEFKMIIAANRDEFYNRKTAAASFWVDHPEILAGRDLEAGGTWLGVTRNGRIGMVTNFRDPQNINPTAPSRGHLVTDFLLSMDSSNEYLGKLQVRALAYNGFNLLVGDVNSLGYYSNYGDGIQTLREGVFGLSNHLLETPWPKVVRGKERFNALLQSGRLNPEDLFALLYDDTVAADHSLPDTGVGLARERALSAMFIKSPGYGTRCSTVMMVDNNNRVMFSERVFDLKTFDFVTNTFEFQVASPAPTLTP